MDLDNPSYFSLENATARQQSNRISLQRITKSGCGGGSSTSSASSVSSLSRQLTPPRNKGKKMKNLARSMSSNSNESYHLIMQGEARLSDMAPDIAAKYSKRSNSIPINFLKQPQMYSALPTSEECADSQDNSEDEVFVGEDSARYYNFSAMAHRGNPRRHSIGTFMGPRDRTGSMTSSLRSFKREEDVPQVVQKEIKPSSSTVVLDDHSLRHAMYPRRRCKLCVREYSQKMANMDDILIVSLKCSSAATLWVDYFSSYFLQISKQANRKPFKIHQLSVEEFAEAKEEERNIYIEKSSGVKLQIVVVCPGFLEYVAESQNANIGKLFLPDRTLALLLGVSDSDIYETHRNVLSTYFKWQRMSVGQDQDENFTKEFVGEAMSILSRIWKQQTTQIAQDKAGFSVSPKKIRPGQSSVFILLTHPLQKDDLVKISIEKNNEIHVIPNLKRRNPYTIKISVPDTYTEVTAIINILVEKNGSIIGARPVKCESRLRELEQILRFTDHPVEFMCQTLGFTPADKEHLDNWLVQNFQRNLPPHFNLLANSTSQFAAGIQAQKHSYEEYPTLLHFAAKFGLEKLAMQLLDCPGADVAYDIKNIFNLTPAQIAESNNHPEIASLLRGYMNMNEFTSMYSKLKEISLSTPPGDCITDEQEYLTPKNFDELYKLCPAPRPVTLNLRRDSHDSNECLTPLGYMAMKTPTPVKEEEPKTEEKKQTKQSHINQTIKTPVLTPTTPNSPNINDLTSTQIKEVEDKVQKELLEIINDFKNNVHSIGQVEKLVDEWKNRNDVQKSFQEKQDQLREMRVRYEEIQRQMKAALKKPSPFDRVKKLFSRSKSREDADSVLTSQDLRQNPNQQRPISSLSISSSGSSGRMSTISGSSLGDSGTHSDNEERKNALKCSEDDFKNELHKAIMELNYTPVPAPKPFKPASISINTQRNKLTTTIEESPSTSSQTISPAQDQYYIQFPASGLPVPGTSAMELFEASKKMEEIPRCFGNEYSNVNSTCLQEISEVPHEYMNFKAPV